MRAVLAYSSARILLFLATAGLAYLAGARGLLMLFLAAAISGLISFVLLSRHRDAMSGVLVSRLRDFRSRLDEGTSAEDED